MISTMGKFHYSDARQAEGVTESLILQLSSSAQPSNTQYRITQDGGTGSKFRNDSKTSLLLCQAYDGVHSIPCRFASHLFRRKDELSVYTIVNIYSFSISRFHEIVNGVMNRDNIGVEILVTGFNVLHDGSPDGMDWQGNFPKPWRCTSSKRATFFLNK